MVEMVLRALKFQSIVFIMHSSFPTKWESQTDSQDSMTFCVVLTINLDCPFK